MIFHSISSLASFFLSWAPHLSWSSRHESGNYVQVIGEKTIFHNCTYKRTIAKCIAGWFFFLCKIEREREKKMSWESSWLLLSGGKLFYELLLKKRKKMGVHLTLLFCFLFAAQRRLTNGATKSKFFAAWYWFILVLQIYQCLILLIYPCLILQIFINVWYFWFINVWYFCFTNAWLVAIYEAVHYCRV